MKDAVFALGMGGPDGPDSIRPFLKNLLNDKEIINFGIGPFQRPLAAFIAARRSGKVAPEYEKMGGGSPQLRLTRELIAKTALIYEERSGIPLDTYIGMCYWHPFIEDSFKELLKAERSGAYRRVYLLPLYPQYATVTTGACYTRVNRVLALAAPKGVICRINQFHTYEPYLKCLAARIEAAADKLGLPVGRCHLMFSAHSTPSSVIEKGDPYVNQLHEQITKLMEIVHPASHSLCYQSKVGRQHWLTPSAPDELESLAAKGIKNIIVLAVSFINDHIETLVEIDESLAAHAERLGVRMIRACSLNGDADFARALSQMLETI